MSEETEGLDDEVDVEDARVVVAKRKARVIDIRSEEDFAEERIFGSSRVDPDDVEARVAEIEDGGEDDDDEIEMILLVCADGSESKDLAAKLRDDGHSVSSLDGGFKAWTSDHLPTAPGRDEEYEGPDVKIPGAVASETEPDDEDEDDEQNEEGEKSPRDEADPAERDEADEQADAAADTEATVGEQADAAADTEATPGDEADDPEEPEDSSAN